MPLILDSRKIPYSDIEVEPGFNPRKKITQEMLDEKKASLKQFGMIGNFLVSERPLEAGQDTPKYFLRAGELRFLSIGQLRKEDSALKERYTLVDAKLVDPEATRAQLKALAVEENLAAEQMDPMDVAQALMDTKLEEGYTNAQLAEKFCKSEFWVSYNLSPAQCIEAVRRAVSDKEITMQHCFLLRSFSDSMQEKLLLHAKSMTPKAFETYVFSMKKKTREAPVAPVAGAEGSAPKEKKARGAHAVNPAPLYSRPPKEVVMGATIPVKLMPDASKSTEAQLAFKAGMSAMTLYALGKLPIEDLPTEWNVDTTEDYESMLATFILNNHKTLVDNTAQALAAAAETPESQDEPAAN